MFQIILIRPGATDYDLQERIQGALDVPLSPEGLTEVARMVDQLRDKGIQVVYAPPADPARQTAGIIAGDLGVKVKKLDRMPNLNLGLWQGLKISEVRHKQPKVYRQLQEQPGHICPPEGEMLGDAQQRVRLAMTKLLRRHKEGVIAICLSEPLATLVRQFVKNDEFGDLWKALGNHGCWEILEPQAATVPALSN